MSGTSIIAQIFVPLIRQCPDKQVIGIHAFLKIYLIVKMSDFEVRTKIFWCFLFKVYTTRYMQVD